MIKFLILLVLSSSSCYCRHHDRKVVITERANYNPSPVQQQYNPNDLLRAAAGADDNQPQSQTGQYLQAAAQGNYNGQPQSQAGQLLQAAAQGNNNGQQQGQSQEQQIKLLQQLLEQQRQQNQYNQRQNPGLGLNGQLPQQYQTPQYQQQPQYSGQQQPQYVGQQQPQVVAPSSGSSGSSGWFGGLGSSVSGIGSTFNQGATLGGPLGLASLFGLPMGGTDQKALYGDSKKTRVNVPFFFSMDKNKAGNDHEENTKLALTSMGGLIRVNVDKTEDLQTGKKRGPTDVWLGPIRVAGRR